MRSWLSDSDQRNRASEVVHIWDTGNSVFWLRQSDTLLLIYELRFMWDLAPELIYRRLESDVPQTLIFNYLANGPLPLKKLIPSCAHTSALTPFGAHFMQMCKISAFVIRSFPKSVAAISCKSCWWSCLMAQ